MSRFKRKKEGGFVGAEKILPQLDVKLKDLSLRRIGFIVEGRAPIRPGSDIVIDGEKIGYVTSGNLSPSLGIPIGMGYVKGKFGKKGTVLGAEKRGKSIEIQVTKMPFIEPGYKR